MGRGDYRRLLAFEDEWKTACFKECRWHLEAERGKEINSPINTTVSNAVLLTS
jgi:hypothetical protein